MCPPASTTAQEIAIPVAGHVDGRRHDLLGALMREALALGDIHSQRPG
jgi:hypothetical protein